MRLTAMILSAGSLILLTSPARAQRDLTLDEALALARRNNHDLAAARGRLVEAEAAVDQTRAQLLPILTGQGRYTHNYKEVSITLPAGLGPSGPIVIQQQEQLDATAAVTVPLIAPAGYPALSSSRHAADAAHANFLVDETSILYQTAQSFFAAAGTDELITARKNAVTVAEKTSADARARFSAGAVNRVEVSRADTALLRARQAEIESEATRDQAYRALSLLIAVKEPLHVVPPELPATEPAAPPLDDALRSRPEVALAQQQIAAADSAARAAGWRWAPTLSGFGNLRGFNYPGFAGDEYSWAIGLQLDWQLYDGGVRDAQRHAADAQRMEAEQRLLQARDSVGYELDNSAQQIGVRRAAVASAQRQLELSRETLELVRQQRAAGTGTQLDLLTAQDSLVASEVALAQARFDLQLANLALARAAGTFPERRK